MGVSASKITPPKPVRLLAEECDREIRILVRGKAGRERERWGWFKLLTHSIPVATSGLLPIVPSFFFLGGGKGSLENQPTKKI